MKITAALVKELRERTGAGMMECKKALVETGGDIEAAVELMRKSGQAKADKKAGRIAAEGMIALKISDGRGVLVEVNCETDFVASDANFSGFASEVAGRALDANPAGVDALNALKLTDGRSVDEARRDLIVKIGENVNVRRFGGIDGADHLGAYVHGRRIGVLVALNGGDEHLARDLAMHVAAANPMCVSADDVPPDLLEKEREIHREQAERSGKPPEIVSKMVDGKLRKFVNEITLLGQPFVKDPDSTVEKLLKGSAASVTGFLRFEVGEGIEKKSEDFAEEVRKQVEGSS